VSVPIVWVIGHWLPSVAFAVVGVESEDVIYVHYRTLHESCIQATRAPDAIDDRKPVINTISHSSPLVSMWQLSVERLRIVVSSMI
jgi:hypothetical protein